MLTQDRILQNADVGMGALKPRERAYMGYLGLDANLARRVATEFKAHVETRADWADASALQRPLPDDMLRIVARGERKDEKMAG